MDFNRINWFGIAAGVLTLLVIVVSLYNPWWQLTIGEDLMKVNASPMNTNFGLLGKIFEVSVYAALSCVLGSNMF